MSHSEAPKFAWTGPALIAATLAAMAWWTWGTWPDPLVDFGRELYFPWQITAGKVMYRDLASMFGPLSPYFNAAMFRLFGVSLLTLVLTNLALSGVLLALLHAIVRRIGGRLAATVAGLVVVLVFVFGRYVGIANYNFICPYSHSSTHGLILGIAAVYFMARYHERPAPARLCAVGLALGLVLLTKSEMFAAAAPAVIAGLILAAWAHGFTAARLARAAGILAGVAALPALAAWALLCMAMPAHEALRGTLAAWWYVFDYRIVTMPFQKWVMGTDDAAGNLSLLLRSAAAYAALLIPAALLALACRRPGRYRSVIAAVLLVAPAGLLLWKFDPDRWAWIARPWPLFMAILAAAAVAQFVKSRRSPDRGAQAALAVTTTVFALLLLSRMLLNSRIAHYGFVLALPAGVVMVAALLDWAPRTLERMGGYGTAFRALALSLILAGAWAHVRLTGANLALCRTEVGSGGDAFRALASGRSVNAALEMIDAEAARTQTLAVLPEGVLINYLSRRPNPTPYGEERMTESYRRHPPDYLLLVHRETAAYGGEFFGKDFAREFYRWIMANYQPVTQIGEKPLQRKGAFGMLLLKHVGDRGNIQ
jgi:hypothetical protein